MDGGLDDDTTTLNLGRNTALLVEVKDSGGDVNDHLIINTTAGKDEVVLEDRAGDPDSTAGTVLLGTGPNLDRVNFRKQDFLTVNTLGEEDTVTVESTHVGIITLNTGGSKDTVRVKSISGDTTINAGGGADLIEVFNDGLVLEDIGAVLTVNGDGDGAGGDGDVLTVIDFGDLDDETGVLTDQAITGLGMGPGHGIIYGTVENLNLSLGQGSDTLDIESTNADTVTTIVSSFGNDTINVQTVSGETNLNTGDGADTVNVGDEFDRLQGIQAQLSLFADFETGFEDTLNISDAGDSFGRTGTLFDDLLIGLGMIGNVNYFDFEEVNLDLGEASDTFTVDSTIAGVTNIRGGKGSDDIEVETVTGLLNIEGNEGSDILTVFDGTGDDAADGAILTYGGGLDDDTTTLNLGRDTGLFVEIQDSGSLQSGANNRLFINTTQGEDRIVLDGGAKTKEDPTPGIVFVGEAGAGRERVNYRQQDFLTVNSLGGDDSILVDDTAVETVINMGRGDDIIVIGTVPTILDTENKTPEFPDGVPVADTANLTKGNSAPLTVNGGAGDDFFEVNHNSDKLFLNGEDGDDTFFINTFLVLDDETDESEPLNQTLITGGAGSDRYSYLQNAPVKISGGDGFDTIVINGTPIGDVIVVTQKFVAGAGRQVVFENDVERIEINGGGGDDQIYILGANKNIETVVRGGSGNDTIHLGGDHPVQVFDPPPVTLQSRGVTVEKVTTETITNTIDPAPFQKVVSIDELRDNPEGIEARFGGLIDDDKTIINSVDVFISFSFFGFSFRFKIGERDVSATITIDPPAIDVTKTITTTTFETIAPPPIGIDPPPFAFKMDALFDLAERGDGFTGIEGKLIIDGSQTADSLGNTHSDKVVVHNEEGTVQTGTLTDTTVADLERLKFQVYVNDSGQDILVGDLLIADGEEFLVGEIPKDANEIPLHNLAAISTKPIVETAPEDASKKLAPGQVPVLDAEGNPDLDDEGNPVLVDGLVTVFEDLFPQEFATDADGNVLFDNGDPVLLNRTFLNLQGLGLGTGTGQGGIAYDGVELQNFEDMEIRLSDKSDDFTIEATHEGTTALILGDGDDHVRVKNISGDTRILGGGGDDTVDAWDDKNTLAGIDAKLTFDGDAHVREEPVPVPTDSDLVTGSDLVFVEDGVSKVNVAEVNPVTGEIVEEDVEETLFTSLQNPAAVTVETLTEGSSVRNEVQRLSHDGASGSFTLTFDGQTTGSIAHDASAADVEAALQGFSNLGDVTVAKSIAVASDGTSTSFWEIEFVNPGGEDVPQIAADFGGLRKDASVTGRVTTLRNGKLKLPFTARSEIQAISHDGTSGSFTLTFNGRTTGSIAHNATASQVKTALNGLSNVGGFLQVSVSVSGAGTAAQPWTITFGKFDGNVSQITANFSNLGKSVSAAGSVNTLTEGSPSASESQRIFHDGSLGSFTLTFDGQETDAIAHDATAADVEFALEALPNLGDIAVTGEGTEVDPWGIEFIDQSGKDLPQITADFTNLSTLVGVTMETVTEGSASESEVQRVFHGGSAGSFTLTFDGRETDPIAHDASATDVEAALEALDNLTDVTVTGAGTESNPWEVEFVDPGEDVSRMAANPLGTRTKPVVVTRPVLLNFAAKDVFTEFLQGEDTLNIRTFGDSTNLTDALSPDVELVNKLDANGRVIFHNAGDPVIDPFTGEAVLHEAGDPVLGENGLPEKNLDGTPKLYEGGEPVLHSEDDPVQVLRDVQALTGLGLVDEDGNDTKINFTGLDENSININTGDGDDIFNIQSTLGGAVTNLNTGGGNDVINVTSATNSLDDILGELNIDAGSGTNVLNVDDSGDPDADYNVVITDSSISGLAPALITYTATNGTFESQFDSATGTFTDGITISAGTGAISSFLECDDSGNPNLPCLPAPGPNGNIITIESTRNNPNVIEVTAVNAGAGDDTVTIQQGDQRYLIVHGETGTDTIDATPTTTGVAVFGDEGNDTIRGGSGDDVLSGGLDDDLIHGNAGDDVILGDNALIVRDASYTVQRIETADESQSGVDVLFGDEDDDIILGGAGGDTLRGDLEGGGSSIGTDIILGDNGVVVRNDGTDEANDVFSRSHGIGGIDIIKGGDGDNIIIGGALGDSITGGLGNEIILGDGGRVTRDENDVITRVETEEDNVGGVDDIDGGAGKDVILGGAEGDVITALLGDNIILGDAGQVNLNSGSNDIFTTNPAVGGADEITGGGDGSNIIIGGAAGDTIKGGIGDDVVLGDGGKVTRDGNSVVRRVETIEDATGGVDDIDGGAGNDVILGGAEGDIITADLGGNIILGDAGEVNLNNTGLNSTNDIFTTSPDVGGVDIITGGANAVGNIIIGGAKGDSITGGLGNDTILGDGGRVFRDANSVVTRVVTGDKDGTTSDEDVPVGGVDTIDGGAGDDVILGGAEGDEISALFGNNIILGDEGEVNLNNAGSNNIFTTNPSDGGADKITGGGDGSNIIIGGAKGDTIVGGIGDDVVLGDGGKVTRDGNSVVRRVETIEDATGGVDDIDGGAGNDVILGGAEGDIITADLGGNIILGDAGEVNLNNTGLNSTNDIFTTSPDVGGVDIITGGTNAVGNIIIGGAKGDSITGGLCNDTILGDGGRVFRDANSVVTRVVTGDKDGTTSDEDVPVGGVDTIDGGAGDDVILGGAEGDEISALFGNNIILGDEGEVNLNNAGSNNIFTTNPSDGGADKITGGGDGSNIIIGGAGADTIIGGSGQDTILGDSGSVDRDGASIVLKVKTGGEGDETGAIGGVDSIDGGAGDDVILGGAEGDIITALFDNNIILGDNGEVNLNNAGSNNIFTTDPTVGGSDTITGGGDGSNIIIGGAGADTIIGGSGQDTILGDSGSVDRDGASIVLKVKTGGEGDETGAIGGVDSIDGGAGDDVILGGAEGDIITALFDNNIILGDNGEVNLNNAGSNNIFTTDPTVGGSDTITGGGDGSNIIIGGAGADTIIGGSGQDTILGDSGSVDRDGASIVLKVKTGGEGDETGAIGGVDSIDGGAGDDVILGGAEGDIITALFDNNIILGDNGEVNLNNAGSNNIFTTDPTVGGSDTITGGGDGSNIIIGGAGADTIIGGSGQDTILGDSGSVDRDGASIVQKVKTGGEVNLNNANTNNIFTTDPTVGGSDTITGGGDGSNIIIGGAGADTIIGGSGQDTILGDSGSVDRDGASIVLKVKTGGAGDETGVIGGVDSIDGGAGDDVILGGAEGDIITALFDNNIILGDNGEVNLNNANTNNIFTTDPTVGGSDTITGGGNGSNIIIGGAGADTIIGGSGQDTILGDSGSVDRDGASIVLKVKTGGAGDETGAIGGVDSIDGGAGDDVILGGAEGDIITALFDNNIILGDNGEVNLNNAGSNNIYTTNAPVGGSDTITGGGDGSNIIIGGAGSDSVVVGTGSDTILGDSGYVTRGGVNPDGSIDVLKVQTSRVETGDPDGSIGGVDTIDGGAGDDGEANLNNADSNDIFTTNPTVGDSDTITGGGVGSNIIIGGAAGDSIVGGGGGDTILGDSGYVTRGGVNPDGSIDVLRVETSRVETGDEFGEIGGVDTIRGAAGDDIILGGAKGDDIQGNSGRDILLGDNGDVVRADGSADENDIFTTEPSIGGADTISGNGDDDILVGGAAGDFLFGNEDNDLLLGDNGRITRDSSDTVLRVASTDTDEGGNDDIEGNGGNDTVLGGFGDDTITGNLGEDILLGDSGEVVRNDVTDDANDIFSIAPTDGGSDLIHGGDGNDIILGGTGGSDLHGTGGDTLHGDDQDNLILGDNGYITRDGNDVVERIASTDTGYGGDDTIIEGNGGNDTILGGTGDDDITGGIGDDIILGDNGEVVRNDGTGQANDIFTIAPTDGGSDTIHGGDGEDIILGGSGGSDLHGAGGDTLHGDDQDDLILGDNGYISRDANDIVERIASTDTSYGGDDTIIEGNGGNDTILGGTGDDDITGGIGNDIILGDNGEVVRNDGTADANDIFSISPADGGSDTITGNAGDDIILGGSGGSDLQWNGIGLPDSGDLIFGNGDNDLILGDNGRITRNGLDRVQKVETISPSDGGDDTVYGNAGEDTILGGAGDDDLMGGAGDDLILGDNGLTDYAVDVDLSTLDFVTTTSPTIGGRDVITGDADDDTIIGGTAADTIDGNGGDDLLFGDHAQVDYLRPANVNFTAIDTGAGDGGGDDSIHGNAGDDTILGQQGDDRLFGDADEDDMWGGHNVVGGFDGGAGNDYMDGGSESDVMLGDNGTITRRFDIGGGWQRYPAPFADVIRDVVRFDDLDGVGGDDTMRGGSGDDIMHGPARRRRHVGRIGRRRDVRRAGRRHDVGRLGPGRDAGRHGDHHPGLQR